ncbi:hypothetical protein K8T06_15480 [bacterium]|nr:hypothetical protein [bacterium]
MKLSQTYKLNPVYIEIAVLSWIVAVQWQSLLIWFDWETVRFFVQPRQLQYRWIEAWHSGWVDLSEYGINIASLTLRPLMTWSFQIESLIFGKWAPGYHILNLAAHLACVWLLMRLLRKMGLSIPAASLTGLLFGLHPLSTQPLWILGDRAEVCVLLGGLFALYHYGSSRILSSLGLLFALYCKETAVTIPGWLLVYDVIFLDRGVSLRRTLRFRFRRIFIPSILTTLYLIHRLVALGGMGGYKSVNHFRVDHIPEVLSYNLAWVLTFTHGHQFFVSGLILISVIVLLPWTPRVTRFSIIWVFLFLLPLNNLCNKWYLYTPTAAMISAIAGCFDPLLRNHRFRLITAMLLLLTTVYFSVLSHAELTHQKRNATLPQHLATKLHELINDIPPNSTIVFILKPPFEANKLQGHFFKPSQFLIKSFKPPAEAIVWDLNATRYYGNEPVWTRSVEAAVRLLYNDITIRVELSDHKGTHKFQQGYLYIDYDPTTDFLRIRN